MIFTARCVKKFRICGFRDASGSGLDRAKHLYSDTQAAMISHRGLYRLFASLAAKGEAQDHE